MELSLYDNMKVCDAFRNVVITYKRDIWNFDNSGYIKYNKKDFWRFKTGRPHFGNPRIGEYGVHCFWRFKTGRPHFGNHRIGEYGVHCFWYVFRVSKFTGDIGLSSILRAVNLIPCLLRHPVYEVFTLEQL